MLLAKLNGWSSRPSHKRAGGNGEHVGKVGLLAAQVLSSLALMDKLHLECMCHVI